MIERQITILTQLVINRIRDLEQELGKARTQKDNYNVKIIQDSLTELGNILTILKTK